MPLYDWKCEDCGHEFEMAAPMSETEMPCAECIWEGRSGGFNTPVKRKFTPTRNFFIPESFRRSATWHMPNGERSTESAPASANNAIHAPRRTSFKEAFDKQWR